MNNRDKYIDFDENDLKEQAIGSFDEMLHIEYHVISFCGGTIVRSHY